MKINTTNFGEIEINNDDVIRFEDGLPGFQTFKQYTIINSQEDDTPFKHLQCIDEPSLSFIIINPFLFKKDYDFTLNDSTVEKLKINSHEDIAIYSIVVIPDDLTKMTANLVGPIIINIKEKLGRQVIIDNKNYKTKHYILEEMVSVSKEEK